MLDLHVRGLIDEQHHTMRNTVLTIAGSDSSGGAGIQADLKAISANGAYGMSVITSITAQNTQEVSEVFHLPVPIIESQLDTLFRDIAISVIKTGMLGTVEIITAVSHKLRQHKPAHLVIDPVMISKSGDSLLEEKAIATMKTELLPQATLLTPNVHEAEVLTGMSIRSLEDARAAAKAMYQMGAQHILLKGGHLTDQPGTDLLYDGRFFRMFKGGISRYPPYPWNRVHLCVRHFGLPRKRKIPSGCDHRGEILHHRGHPTWISVGKRAWPD